MTSASSEKYSIPEIPSGAPPDSADESPYERKQRLKREHDAQDLEARLKALKKRMERAQGQYDELGERIDKMRSKFKKPLPKPKVAPYKPMVPPPEVRRKQIAADAPPGDEE